MPITCLRRMPLSHMPPNQSARMTQVIHAKLQTPRLRLNGCPLPHRRPKRRSARCRRSERLLRATPLRPRLRRRQRRLPRDKSHPKGMHLNSPHPRRLHLVRPRPESPHQNRPRLTILHMKLPRQNRLHPMPTRRLLKNQTHSARAGASAAVKSGADIVRARQTPAWLALIASAFFAKTQPEPRNWTTCPTCRCHGLYAFQPQFPAEYDKFTLKVKNPRPRLQFVHRMFYPPGVKCGIMG